MDKIYKIAACVQRYLMGYATEDDRKEVEGWLEEDGRHRELLDEYCSNDHFQDKIKEHEVFNQNRAFQRFLKSGRRVRKNRIYRVVSVAAVVFVVLSISLYFQKDSDESTRKTLEPYQAIRPGNNRAVLVFGSGEEILLKDSMECQMLGNTTKITVEGNQVRYSENRESLTGEKKAGVNAIITPKGGEYELVLTDGTRVWINADSRLEFPEKFQEKEREVYLKGEAYFEVARDVERPFRVKTDKTVVKVLGTSFNIQAYEGEILRTTLVSGNVAVEYGGEEVKIVPGEQWILKEGRFYVEKVNEQAAIRWLKGDFVFDDAVLSDVFKVLERWYDIQVFACDAKVNDMKFTGVFPRYADIDRVLNMIELATCTRMEIKNRTISVYVD